MEEELKNALKQMKKTYKGKEKLKPSKMKYGRKHAKTKAPESGYFIQQPPQNKKIRKIFYKLENGQTFIDGLKYLNPNLITKANNKQNVSPCKTVQDGEIGLAQKNGRVKFFPPGTYYSRSMIKNYNWYGVRDLSNVSVEQPLKHGDITLFALSENLTVVVQIDKVQYIIGSSRYILKEGADVRGKPIDFQNLSNKHKAEVITEAAEDVTDKGFKNNRKEKLVVDQKVRTRTVQIKKIITAGRTDQAGGITFIRPDPGFQYVVKIPKGYRVGTEFTVARGEEDFYSFVNCLQQSRTTATFEFLSKDSHNVQLSVQLTWQLKDTKIWLENGLSYDDPFDVLEEKAQAYLKM